MKRSISINHTANHAFKNIIDSGVPDAHAESKI